MRELTLPSGATLRIEISSFPVSKALYQAVLRELKGLSFTANAETGELLKEFFCLAFSSMQVEACLWECFKKCAYTNKEGTTTKITPDTFESEESREDYFSACVEVAKDNIAPFMKSLFASFKTGLVIIDGIQKQK